MSILSQTQATHIGIVTISDRFDIAAVSQFRQAADQMLSQTNYIVIDMTTVSFFDSAGMAALVNVLKQCPKTRSRTRWRYPSCLANI
jgi:anti-sigma B factor antagonist